LSCPLRAGGGCGRGIPPPRLPPPTHTPSLPHLLPPGAQSESKARGEQIHYIEAVRAQVQGEVAASLASLHASVPRLAADADARCCAVEATLAASLTAQEDALSDLSIRVDCALGQMRSVGLGLTGGVDVSSFFPCVGWGGVGLGGVFV
jgi:hypothetical protein